LPGIRQTYTSEMQSAMAPSQLVVSLLGLLGLLGLVVSATAAPGCARIWSPVELTKAAKRLDTQVVCVRALLRPLPLQDRSSVSVSVYEAVPLDATQRQLETNRIGLVEWDMELGIAESLHRPESYDLIEGGASKCPGIAKDELSFDAEFRAVVEHRKGLTERAYASPPPSLSPSMPRRTHYDTELVILEFLRVTGICKK